MKHSNLPCRVELSFLAISLCFTCQGRSLRWGLENTGHEKKKKRGQKEKALCYPRVIHLDLYQPVYILIYLSTYVFDNNFLKKCNTSDINRSYCLPCKAIPAYIPMFIRFLFASWRINDHYFFSLTFYN